MTTKNTGTILVVDDDTAHRTMLKTLISRWGYEITEADDGSTAIEQVETRPFDLVLMDIRMLKVSGLEALEVIRELNPALPVIIMTAYSSVDTAVAAMKNGAYDYLTKPLDFDKLKVTLQRATEHCRLREENRALKESLGKYFDRREIIGKSTAMTDLLTTIARVAPSEATLLITGESGTGKELIAAATHYNSPRRDKPFVKINCAAITETLFESELFGHEKGSFTGADKRKDGHFVLADGGSIFLDEISEMPLPMQVKLLRVLQERELTRVGGEAVIKVDVRIITATNRSLPDLIKEGAFREDLYYRLNVIEVDMPPLRERREDIPLLAEHFRVFFAGQNRKELKGFTPGSMDHLIRYGWPGNVRELRNAVERGVVMATGEYLDLDDLPALATDGISPGDAALALQASAGNVTLDEVEKSTILQTLEATEGNKSEAARRLGITRKTLHKKLKLYGVMP